MICSVPLVSRTHALGTNRFDRVYAYDGMDRLASDGDVDYAYDAAGNRTTRTEDGEAVTYILGQGDRLASWTGGSYAYDAAGCVTQITRGADTWDLAWNGQYQLVSVSTNGAFAESYAYDALGRRVTTTNAEGTERHVYDDNWQVLADLDSNGNVLRSYVWGAGIDRLVLVKIGTCVYTALTDVQGTVWGYADEQGAIVARWTYDAWGNVLSEEIAPSAAELRMVRYRFQCRERSAATGLVNFRMRWYDAATGRWLSKDPIGLNGGLNLYVFCGDDPVNVSDGCGLCPEHPQLKPGENPKNKPSSPKNTWIVSVFGGRAAATLGGLGDVSILVDSDGNVGVGLSIGVGFGVEVATEIPGTSVTHKNGGIQDQGGWGVEGHAGVVGGVNFDPTAKDQGVINGGSIGNIGGGVYGAWTYVYPLFNFK